RDHARRGSAHQGRSREHELRARAARAVPRSRRDGARGGARARGSHFRLHHQGVSQALRRALPAALDRLSPQARPLGAAGPLAAPWAVEWREVPWRRFAPLLVPLALYYLFLILSISASYEPRLSIGELGDATRLATLVLALLLVRGEQPVRRVIGGLVLVATLLALGGVVQLLTGQGGIDHRIRGPVSHYMTYSGVVLMSYLLLLSRLSTPGGW